MAQDANQMIADFLHSCRNDPLKYVLGAFPWNTEPSIQVAELHPKYRERFPNVKYGPDLWQCEYLEQLGEQIKANEFNGRDAVKPIRFSTVSGHGIGKSTISAWLVKFILDTRPMSVGTVTANTAPQLRTKTWAEVGKWHNMSLTKDWFKYSNSTSVMSLVHSDPELKEKWKCFAQTCDPTNSEAFAGQHSSATSFYIFDEASKIDQKLFEVREGGLIGGEPMVFDFGNGTRNTGRFYENCVGKYSDLYTVFQIDSRQAQRVNKAKVEEDIKVYGADSDYVRVRWRGLFPAQSTNQFISASAVREASEREAITDHRTDPLIIGVDVARSMSGDETIIYPRIGYDCRSFAPRRYRGLNSIQIADKVSDMVREFQHINKRCSAIFVDMGGGYGGGVYDQLQKMGLNPTGVHPGRTAFNDVTYSLRIDECWGGVKDNIQHLLLPHGTTKDGAELFDQLTQREYGHTLKEQVRLEPKEQFADRIGQSPDITDALAMTFGRPVHDDASDGPAFVYIEGDF